MRDRGVQEPSTSSASSPRLFALLIGINKYKSDPLSGAVQDAINVEYYLHKTLGVPCSQIKTLIDEAATYEGISNALEDLTTDDQISRGDAILIYFAGHGTEAAVCYKRPNERSQAMFIVPYDADTSTTRMIADSQLALYLTRISKAKGDNITVILDCCCSGSGTCIDDNRGRICGIKTMTHPSLNPSSQNIRPRNELRWSKAVDNSPITWTSADGNETSHVLLAACEPNGVAYEEGGQGLFTRVLLETLGKQRNFDKFTYKDLIKQIGPWDNQTPQCKGINQVRPIFNGKVACSTKHLHAAARNDTYSYDLEAGVSQGINKGEKCRLYPSRATFAGDKPFEPTIVDKGEDSSIMLEPVLY